MYCDKRVWRLQYGDVKIRISVRIFAPAKVNLFLRIVGQRSDGYHLLDSLMAPVSLYDAIEIQAERREQSELRIRLTCDKLDLPTDQSNLAYRAALLMCRETETTAIITIDLQKNIPAGAGLGGGSSDAAAVLKALNRLLSLGLNVSQLCQLAAQIGADVPFFIPCRLARVGGIGEILTPLPPLPRHWLVIVVPPFAVSTPWAYRRFDELSADVACLPADSTLQITAQQWPDIGVFVNDLEQAVLPEHPLIARIKSRLLELGAEMALMSGSGSAVFGVFTEQLQAQQAAATFTDSEQTFVVTVVEQALE